MSALATAADVRRIAETAVTTGRIGIDTEFMGEGRYRSLLCVVQAAVATPDGADVVVIDTLDPDVDTAPLAAVLANPDVEVVMHACRQDVPLLRRSWNIEITSLFDTQVAAGFAGLRAQLGYEALVQSLLGVSLRKSASFTKWDRRPLTDEQVHYAEADVLHLLDAATALSERLTQMGRLRWAREECRPLEHLSDERTPEVVFAKLPRVNGLSPRARAVAWELAVWREETARDRDRPASSVLQDAGLVEIAKRRPADAAALEQIRGVNPGAIRQRRGGLLAAVARGSKRDEIAPDQSEFTQPHPDDAGVVVLAEALVRARARDVDMAYEVIAARADLQRIVTAVRTGSPTDEATTNIRTLQGWRRDVAGSELLELLAGRRALRLGPDLRPTVTVTEPDL